MKGGDNNPDRRAMFLVATIAALSICTMLTFIWLELCNNNVITEILCS